MLSVRHDILAWDEMSGAGVVLGSVEPFNGCKDDWPQYVERLEHFFVANGVDTAEKGRGETYIKIKKIPWVTHGIDLSHHYHVLHMGSIYVSLCESTVV